MVADIQYQEAKQGIIEYYKHLDIDDICFYFEIGDGKTLQNEWGDTYYRLERADWEHLYDELKSEFLAEKHNKCDEWCPYCESEVEINIDFKNIQYCPNCGKAITPCNICDKDHSDCSNCYIAIQCESINENL